MTTGTLTAIARCLACKSTRCKQIETVSSSKLAQYWSAFDPAAAKTLLSYCEKGEMPTDVSMFECESCGLQFAHPGFAASGDWYSDVERYGVRWEFNVCLDTLTTSATKILEIGCGEGIFLELAAKRGHDAVGIDFNNSAVAVANTKGLTAYAKNLKDLSEMVETKFDAVAFFHVIEHLEDLDNFFADLSNVMADNAKLFFSCPGPRRYTYHLEPQKTPGLRDVWDYPPHHQSRWNKKAAEKMLSRFGWELKSYQEEPFNWLGTSIYLLVQDLEKRGRKLSDYGPLKRRVKILTKMFQTLVPSLRYKGMSMYCMAVKS